jgi:hypothetical protein
MSVPQHNPIAAHDQNTVSSTTTTAKTTTTTTSMSEDALVYLHYASPIILVIFFLLSIAAHSVTVSKENDPAPSPHAPHGPGGKPLPKRNPSQALLTHKPVVAISRSRKYLFLWLTIGVAFTFVINSGIIIFHALYGKWWCGQAFVVSPFISVFGKPILSQLRN